MIKKFVSAISGAEFPIAQCVEGKSIRTEILNFIIKKHPDFSIEKSISLSELARFREDYVTDMLLNSSGELSDLESKVIASLKNNTLLFDQLDEEIKNMSLGQKIADKVASFGGSWTFIISFIVVLIFWIWINAILFVNKSFDPYPFILLNLILSCVAALQAPVIMMSQNRTEERDRERAKKDYMINLKSELEIRILHEKIDHLIMHQEQSMIEIQRVQMDMMKEILEQMQIKKA
ncbi:DUF1003 domain-containing protein [Flavobacterium sp.]|uniref:DUF1003 domain-containing protein n=1 Tax=Flavobacterium sp. TaxID=239 RepID=UPI00262E0138|nr:DUF1003 domain-containing protein [Flavobacterium sp.]MDD3005020.1 DUF1003 domain-containing protein [Flavobacterium sp.]